MRKAGCGFGVLVGEAPATEVVDAQGQIWISVHRGDEFALVFINELKTPLMACATVDGLSIMTGKPGSDSTHGYLIDAGKCIRIPGWRLDEKRVARFVFGRQDAGYAAQMGFDTGSVGTLRCSFYEEEPEEVDSVPVVMETATRPPLPARSAVSRDDPRGAKAAIAGIPFSINPTADVRFSRPRSQQRTEKQTDDVSVEFGAPCAHRTTPATFSPKSEPLASFTIRYDSSKGLRSRGIGCEPPPGWLKRIFG